ncbi:MAG: hypothetical protein HQL16_03100 [Candidatus Omnitrophica bacterium]|nr:hypothetical protein [Candidatus Omnitrophota bacterium]
MKKIIKQILNKYLQKGFASTDLCGGHSFDIKKFPAGYFRSFGRKNPDKVFYVIWRDHGGSGFFSNVSHVLCHLKIADQAGMIPVVDFQNFKTLYNENEAVNNTRNAWEYYFQQVAPVPLAEVYESQNVFFCSGVYPPSMSYCITKINGLHDEIYKKYIFLQKYIEGLIAQHSVKFNGRILGVHFRGQEQKRAPLHSFPPTEKQMVRCTDEIIEKYKIDKIFLVTEDQGYLDLFVNRYGKRVLHTGSYRTHSVNAYNLNPREKHRYLLGMEILVDSFLLSRCHGILHGDSNVSEFARFINNGEYEFSYDIQNGVNSANILTARYLYEVKKMLPSCLGGLPGKILITSKVTKG